MKSELDVKLNDSFRKVSALVRRTKNEERRGNAPTTQNRVLTILSMNDGINQRQLSYILGVRPQSSGEIIAKMEVNDLVTRVRDETDSRVHRIFLTEKGKERVDQLASHGENSLFDVLSYEEKETMLTSLEKIIDSQPEMEPRHMGRGMEKRDHGFPREQEMFPHEPNRGCHGGRDEGRRDCSRPATGRFPEKGFDFDRDRGVGRYTEKGRDFLDNRPSGRYPERRHEEHCRSWQDPQDDRD